MRDEAKGIPDDARSLRGFGFLRVGGACVSEDARSLQESGQATNTARHADGSRLRHCDRFVIAFPATRFPMRFLKLAKWHCVHPEEVAILRCTRPCAAPPKLTGQQLLHVRAGDESGCELALATMQRVGEAADDVARRFDEGHRFFALRVGNEIAAFCWVTTGGRSEIGNWIPKAPERAVIYNVFTLERHRNRSMATMLLLNVQAELAHEGLRDIVAGASMNNDASIRTLETVGFSRVASSRCMVLFRRLRLFRRMRFHDPSAADLFGDVSQKITRQARGS
jgi:ribosomal protein S18 acetylase RimI-like enzyme